MSIQTQQLSRYTIVALLFIVALNAFGGGYYGMAGAKDVPPEWLEGSPFNSYFIPALILFTVVGGSCLAGGIMILRKYHNSRMVALTCGWIMLGWIVTQLSIIGYVSWMQPAIALIGMVVILLALVGNKQLGANEARTTPMP